MIIIDGNPDYMIGFAREPLDWSEYEMFQHPFWNGPPLTAEQKLERCAAVKQSWVGDEVRRKKASSLMSELRKNGKIKPLYTPERNAKISAAHARRRLEKLGETK